jgi:hypothetical protein
LQKAARGVVKFRRERPDEDEIPALGEYLRRSRKAGGPSAEARELIDLAVALAIHSPGVTRPAEIGVMERPIGDRSQTWTLCLDTSRARRPGSLGRRAGGE